MSCAELQQEEIEVLESIYDGDENFKKIDLTTYQYKICFKMSFCTKVMDLIAIVAKPSQDKEKKNYHLHIRQDITVIYIGTSF